MAAMFNNETLQRLEQLAASRGLDPEACLKHLLDEQQVSESGLRGLKELFDMAEDGLVISSSDGYFHQVNPAMVRITGRSEATLLSTRYLDFVHPDDHSATINALSQLNRGDPLPLFTNRYIRPDGSIRWLAWSSGHGPDGTIYGVARDITDEYTMRRELKQHEDLMLQFVEAATEGIIVVQGDGRIIVNNASAQRMFGSDVRGQQISVLLGMKVEARPGDMLQIPELITKQINTRDELILSVTVLTVALGENVVSVYFLRDIRQIKAMEEEHRQTQSLRLHLEQERDLVNLKNRFLSMVSHEFRTPLTVILSSCQIVRKYYDRLSRQKITERIQIIEQQTRRMNNLLEDVLSYNALGSGMMSCTLEAVNPTTLFETIIETMSVVRRDGERIQLSCQNCPPSALLLDPRLIEHILINLLSNALKYSPVTASVNVILNHKGDRLEFSVVDRGIGIPAEEQKQLYQPFFRASNSAEFEGTGLGMSIVYEAVRVHGGRIAIESAEGRGTHFIVDLPAQLPAIHLR